MTERWAWAEIDLGAVARNVVRMRAAAQPAGVWAVVKADGYGHGALRVARAAQAAGATGLCVALVQEGVALRRAGVGGPILVLSEQPPEQLDEAVEHDLALTVYSATAVEAANQAAQRRTKVGYPVHLKVDTGMHRVGCHPADAAGLIERIEASPGLALAGVATHLAVADEPDDPYTGQQLATFATVRRSVPAGVLVHAANSAGALAHPAARHDVVRVGIALYGISPGPGVGPWVSDLEPVLSLRAKVSHRQRRAAGDRISYGLRHTFGRDTTVATLPIGYADGVPRRLSSTGGVVLIGGRRRPIVGVVTMDQLMVDLGDDEVAIGDEAVLIGRQGDEEIRAAEWAERLGTIGYEIVCGMSARVPRRYRE
ncbi:MAG: alanine racemase [Acidimicrobiales bacterium]